ncbi:MAG TPA: ketoacyl-ACP synthase III family protein [Streptosporangiaceae bacterium]
MRWTDIYLAGAGTCLPAPESAELAVAAGRYDPQEHKDNELISVLAAGAETAVDMAVGAGRQALARSGHDAGDIALLLHSNTYHQGEDLWTPATYVQAKVIGGDAPSIQLNHACDGGMAALELSIPYLLASPGRPAALLTTGDRFVLPGFERWHSDIGLVFGDGGTAVVASRRGGFARVLATHSSSEPDFEELYRDTVRGFTDAPHLSGEPLDLRTRKRRFAEKMGLTFVMERLATGLRRNVDRTLDDAGADLDSMAWIVLPNLGRSLLTWQLLAPLKLDLDRTLWDWGRKTGHLGAGDQFAGLTYLVESAQVAPGDLVLLAGVGIGYCWTSAVVEIGAVPDWSGPDAATLRI